MTRSRRRLLKHLPSRALPTAAQLWMILSEVQAAAPRLTTTTSSTTSSQLLHPLRLLPPNLCHLLSPRLLPQPHNSRLPSLSPPLSRPTSAKWSTTHLSLLHQALLGHPESTIRPSALLLRNPQSL